MRTKNTDHPLVTCKWVLARSKLPVTACAKNHFSLVGFLLSLLSLMPNPEIITLFIVHSLWPFCFTQNLCKWNQALKIIITLSVKIMHIYNVCFNHQFQCSIMRCCAQEYTTLCNSLLKSTEMAQMVLHTTPHIGNLICRNTDQLWFVWWQRKIVFHIKRQSDDVLPCCISVKTILEHKSMNVQCNAQKANLTKNLLLMLLLSLCCSWKQPDFPT